MSLSNEHKHTHMGNWPEKPKWTLQSSCWIASPQNWQRLWSSVACSVRQRNIVITALIFSYMLCKAKEHHNYSNDQGNIMITAIIFSHMLCQAKEHRDHSNDLYRRCCAPDNRFSNVRSPKNHFPSVRSDQKLSTLRSTTYISLHHTQNYTGKRKELLPGSV